MWAPCCSMKGLEHADFGICRDSGASPTQINTKGRLYLQRLLKMKNSVHICIVTQPATDRNNTVGEKEVVVSVIVIPALRRPRQKNCCEFEASLGYSLRAYLTKKKQCARPSIHTGSVTGWLWGQGYVTQSTGAGPWLGPSSQTHQVWFYRHLK